MKRNPFSTSVLMSFSELAFIALLSIALLHSLYVGDSNRKFKELQAKVISLQNKLRNITEEKKTAEQTNEITEEIKDLKEEIEAITYGTQNKDQTIRKLREDLTKTKLEINTLKQAIAKALKQNNNYIAERDKANIQLEELEKQLALAVKEEYSIRKELVGLKGALDHVIFVLDCSGSMKRSGRWEEACKTTETWLQHLSVKECALITFSKYVDVFPPKNEDQEHLGFLDMTGDKYEENLRYLNERLKKVEPKDSTNTLAALQKAFEYEQVSMIVLFTDGAPTREPSLSGIFKGSVETEILELCRERKRTGRNVPINIVGIGDYFDKKLGTFLLQLTEETGGTFIGR